MDDIEQTKCQKCRPAHKYMHKDVYYTQQLRLIDDSVLWRYGILSSILPATFVVKYYSRMGSELDC